MGSATSKDSPAAAADPSSSSSLAGGPRRLRSRVFSSSCFGLPSALPDEDEVEDENGSTKANSICGDEIETKSRKLRSCRHRKMPPLELCDDVERNEYDDADVDGESSVRDPQIDLGASSSAGSSNADAAVSSNPSSRSRSRFGLIPDRIGLRLSRTISLGSLRAQPLFSESSDDVHVDSQNVNEDNASGVNDSLQDIVQNNAVAGSDGDDSSFRNEEMRRSNRRIGPQEPLEGSVRFSRTLSVGRLRDRVLRRTSSSAGIFGSALPEDRSAYGGQVSERRALGGRRRMPPSPGNEIWPDYLRSHPYHIGSLTDRSYDSESRSSQLREGNGHDLLEHRSAFLERRRRIRSQVHALQRLGSRFENLSGHERSCILSGQHRTGRCTCRTTSNRAANPSDDTGTRASISRIVVLAEALFEVLDEIHQQSVALTSRPSFSSIGSVPAPKEVVECMPLKVYMKTQKHQNEEAAQCYICLVEYEDGDFMRILPCNHEFHQTCIDKWLKEIHRVCPLCRGDVCRSEVPVTNKMS